MGAQTRIEGIQIHRDFFTFQQIHLLYGDSEYGQILINNTRFNRFKPDEVSQATWEKLLGIDVNNYRHLHLSLHLTRIFLNNSESPPESWPFELSELAVFTQEEKEKLLFTAIIHDWAEAVVGDIALPLKTNDDTDTEMMELKTIMKKLLYDDKDTDQFNYLYNQVKTILTDTTSKLGMAFNAIEKVGYVRTGVRAWIQSKVKDKPIQKPLENLALEVVPFSINALLDYSKIYPPVYSFLRQNNTHIGQILRESGEKNLPLLEKFISLVGE